MVVATTEDGNRIGLTDQELGYLQKLLGAGDRAGFYMAYYEMVRGEPAFVDSADAMILQAQISSFSGPIGGVAIGSNALLQEIYRDAPPGAGQYQGIYYLSQQVAESNFEAIQEDLTGDLPPDGVVDQPTHTGYLNLGDAIQAAQRAWTREGQQDQFPVPSDRDGGRL